MVKKMQTTTSPVPSYRIFLPIVLAGILIATIFIAGCTSQTATSPAVSQQTSPVVSIGDIVKNPSAYNKTDVLVRGKIINECGSGCWFMLNDGTGLIYVDLSPNNFAIPQLQGSTVSVEGTIYASGEDVTLFAKSIKTDARTYP
jgi:uncharacterized protein YdeI (BOF family)